MAEGCRRCSGPTSKRPSSLPVHARCVCPRDGDSHRRAVRCANSPRNIAGSSCMAPAHSLVFAQICCRGPRHRERICARSPAIPWNRLPIQGALSGCWKRPARLSPGYPQNAFANIWSTKSQCSTCGGSPIKRDDAAAVRLRDTYLCGKWAICHCWDNLRSIETCGPGTPIRTETQGRRRIGPRRSAIAPDVLFGRRRAGVSFDSAIRPMPTLSGGEMQRIRLAGPSRTAGCNRRAVRIGRTDHRASCPGQRQRCYWQRIEATSRLGQYADWWSNTTAT